MGQAGAGWTGDPGRAGCPYRLGSCRQLPTQVPLKGAVRHIDRGPVKLDWKLLLFPVLSFFYPTPALVFAAVD